MSNFFVHIEIIKNAVLREVVKNFKKIGRKPSKLIQLLK